MGKLDGKVAFITGVARGQGRSHAVGLAEEGADIIGVDLCRQLDTVSYPMSTPEDLQETARLIEKAGRHCLLTEADVRDQGALREAFDAGVAEFGGFDGYVAAKFGVVGLMESYAIELAEYSIRVNTVHPSGAATPMVENDFFGPYMASVPKVGQNARNKLPVRLVEAVDVTRMILFLVSDDGRYVTGTRHRVDAGFCV
ncbi:hypothetical protein GCM10009836_34370 [Pseudonocardia ailaonensis]|uniref:SDR family mycofactocin-dependent oxidoreductase n=1 Tax=Pseudonocardia ailaonensis TaxID=367279 RepID=A0ABN2N3Y0_9PSEU